MRFSSTIVFLTLVTSSLALGADAPPAYMTHMIVEMTGSEIPSDSFAAKPKIMWRAATAFCRIDEEPDEKYGIHGRIIIHEPDVWMVNRADNTARHFVDKGPTFNCRLPMFAFDAETLKTKIGELEFGRELEFFQKNGAVRVDGPKVSFAANYYELKIDDAVLRLVEIADIHAPKMVGFTRGTKSYVVEYHLWDDHVPFKPEVFAKPSDVKIEEQELKK